MESSLPRDLSLTLVVLFVCSFLVERGHAGEPIRLRVLCYNIHHGEGVDRKLDLPRIARVIGSVKPDVVALQEVDNKTERTGKVDQAAELARLTQMQVVFGGNIQFQGGGYGNAVLSRHPIVGHKNHRLPNMDDGEQRGVLATEIRVPGLASPLMLFATHLDHRRDDQERRASAKAINALVADSQRPALLAGDLNDVIGSATLKRLDSVWTRTNPRPLPTVPVARPRRQIDFILYRPAKRWKTVEVKVLDEAVASDHRAIFAVVQFQPGR